MGFWASVDRSGARALIEALWEAKDHAPIDEIELLIDLAQKKSSVRKEVLEILRSTIYDDGDDLTICWFGAAASELGRDGLLLCIEGVGRSEGELGNEALVPILQAHILDVFHEVMREIHRAEEVDRRRALYEVVEAALVAGDVKVKSRLRTFALERWEAEKADPEGIEVLDDVLGLLVGAGDDCVRERIGEARGLCRRDDMLNGKLSDIEAAAAGELDLLEVTRLRMADDWKATLRNVEMLAGWRPLPGLKERAQRGQS